MPNQEEQIRQASVFAPQGGASADRRAEQEQERARKFYQERRMALSSPLGEIPSGGGVGKEKKKEVEKERQKQERMTPRRMREGLGEVRRLAKKAKESDGAGAAGEAGAQAAYQGAQMATGRLLQASWSSMPTLWWSVPALIWINIHFFARYLFGSKLFCKFGEEWTPKIRLGTNLGGKGLEIAEFVGMFVLDIILLLILLVITGLIGFLVYIANNPWEVVKEAGLGGVKVIWDMLNPGG